MDRRGPPGREPSRIDRKSLRHVLYGNNPRSLTRRLQAKLVHERTASRRKRHALGRARPHFPRSTAAPEGAWKTDPKNRTELTLTDCPPSKPSPWKGNPASGAKPPYPYTDRLRTRVGQGPQLGRALTGSSFGDRLLRTTQPRRQVQDAAAPSRFRQGIRVPSRSVAAGRLVARLATLPATCTV